jgi:hypothetical protein
MFERLFGRKATEASLQHLPHLNESINRTKPIEGDYGDINELMDTLIRNNVLAENLPYLCGRRFFINNNKYAIVLGQDYCDNKYRYRLTIYIFEPKIHVLPNDSRCCAIAEHYDEIVKCLRNLSYEITEDREKSQIAKRQSEYCLQKLWERVGIDKP